MVGRGQSHLNHSTLHPSNHEWLWNQVNFPHLPQELISWWSKRSILGSLPSASSLFQASVEKAEHPCIACPVGQFNSSSDCLCRTHFLNKSYPHAVGFAVLIAWAFGLVIPSSTVYFTSFKKKEQTSHTFNILLGKILSWIATLTTYKISFFDLLDQVHLHIT